MATHYNYTVGSLLHEAGRHRRHLHCGSNLANCRCEDDHVIELRMVVAALNQLPYGTYSHNALATLVDFFNKNHRNWERLSHDVHQQKTRAVDKWIRGQYLSDDEMVWIDFIRHVWIGQSQRQLGQGFDQFKQALNSVLRMTSEQRTHAI